VPSPTHRHSSSILGLVFLTSLLSSGIGVFAKISLLSIPTMSFIFLRFFIAALILFPFARKRFPVARRPLLELTLVSCLATANTYFFAFGIKYTTANISQMLYAAVPILVTLISIFFLRRRITKRTSLGIAIGFLGTAIFFALPMITSGQTDLGSVKGNLLIFLAVIFYSLYLMLSQKLHDRFSLSQIVFVFTLVSTLASSLFALSDLHTSPRWWVGVPVEAILGLLYVATVGTVLAFFLGQLIVKKADPLTASLTQYIQPFMTFVWAAMLLNEKLTAVFVLGVICSLIGVYLTTSAERSKMLPLPPVDSR